MSPLANKVSMSSYLSAAYNTLRVLGDDAVFAIYSSHLESHIHLKDVGMMCECEFLISAIP